MAYAWYDYKIGRYGLRVANLNGDPNPRHLFDNADIQWISPQDWSPDGKWIVARLAPKAKNSKTGQIGLIAAQDGSLRVLKSVEWRGSRSGVGRILFSPDGKYLAYDRPAGGASRQRDVFLLAIDGGREIPVVAGPTQEEMVGWWPDGKYLLFTSDRTGSRGLWALFFANGTPQGNPELIKADVGQIYPMGLSAAGALYYGVPAAWVLPHIQVATFDFGTGKFLSPPVDVAPEGVLESNTRPDWSPDGKYLAYMSRSATGSGSCSIKIRSTETGQVRELRPTLNYPLYLRWVPDGRSFTVQEPGQIQRVDAETRETSLLVSKAGVQGFAPLSPDGKKIYYRHVGSDGVDFVELDLASGNERELIRQAPSDIGNVQLSPDGRYIATASVDPAANSKTMLLIPVAGGEPRDLMRAGSKVDFKNLIFSVVRWAPDSRSLLVRKSFVDGKQAEEVWQVSLDGSQPRKLDVRLDQLGKGGFRMHPNGRQIAFVPAQERAGQARSAEVWVLENFLPAAKAAK